MEGIKKITSLKAFNVSYIGGLNTSAKILKSLKNGVSTYILYLSPSKISGYNTCAMANRFCKIGCLNTSGRAKMQDKLGTIGQARLTKTIAYFEQRNLFMNILINEINNKSKLVARKSNLKFSVRLNGTSDINWAATKFQGKNIFDWFPNVQFYDYTKIAKKFNNLPANYDLTYSYSGENWTDCKDILNKGYNVAAIFDTLKGKELPKTFNGYEVIDGDLTDYRVDDKKGVIVGLRWKDIRDKKDNNNVLNSKFVVKAKSIKRTEKRCARELSLA